METRLHCSGTNCEKIFQTAIDKKDCDTRQRDTLRH